MPRSRNLNIKQRRRLRRDGFGEVRKSRPVCRTDLNYLGTAQAQDGAQTKPSAGFERLPVGYNHFASARDGSQDQHHAGSVGVGYQGIVGARKLAEMGRQQGMPRAAQATLEVVVASAV